MPPFVDVKGVFSVLSTPNHLCVSTPHAVLDPQHIKREGVPGEAGEGWSYPGLDQGNLWRRMLMDAV